MSKLFKVLGMIALVPVAIIHDLVTWGDKEGSNAGYLIQDIIHQINK